MVLGQKKRRRFCRWRSCRSCVLHTRCCGAKTALEARPVPGLELGPAGEELVLPAPADSSTPGVPQHDGSCHRKPSRPPAPPMEPWVWGWGANHSPQCSCSPGGRGARRGSKAWACPRVSKWISAEPKGATFGPKAPEWVGPAPTSGGGAGTESGRGLLHSRATLAPQCYIRDRAEP